jgi:hypothetical protein
MDEIEEENTFSAMRETINVRKPSRKVVYKIVYNN